MEQILHWDHEAFIYLNQLGSKTWDWFWIFITNKFASFPLYAYLIYLLFKTWGWQNTVVILVLVAGLITCTDQLAETFKDSFQRPRPCHENFANARFIADCGKYGFFSAHAASSFALAVYLGNILKRRFKYGMAGMIIWACIVSYSRIYVGVHYPTDVIVGVSIGSIIGFVFYNLYAFIARRSLPKL